MACRKFPRFCSPSPRLYIAFGHSEVLWGSEMILCQTSIALALSPDS